MQVETPGRDDAYAKLRSACEEAADAQCKQGVAPGASVAAVLKTPLVLKQMAVCLLRKQEARVCCHAKVRAKLGERQLALLNLRWLMPLLP